MAIIGGLQSPTNPGRNLARATRPRRPTLGGRPTYGWGAWTSTTPAPPPTPAPVYHPPATPTPPWRNPWADPTHQGDPNWQVHQAAHPVAPAAPVDIYTAAIPGAPAAGALPGRPTVLGFDQWLATNPAWLAATGSNINAKNQLMASAGFYRDAHGNLIADPNAAPDSTIAGLKLSLGRNKMAAAQNAANRGILFSGATQNEIDKSTDQYGANVGKTLGTLQEGIGSIDRAEGQQKLDLSPDYQAAIANTKVTSPGEVFKQYHDMGNLAARVSNIDAYLKAYGSMLSPAELQRFKTLRGQTYQQWVAKRDAALNSGGSGSTSGKPAGHSHPTTHQRRRKTRGRI